MIEAFNQKRSHFNWKKLSGQEVVYPRSLVRINFESATLSFHTGSTAWWYLTSSHHRLLMCASFKLHQSLIRCYDILLKVPSL
jgi:hypothetical protein